MAGARSQDTFIQSADNHSNSSQPQGRDLGQQCRSKPDSHSACLVRGADRQEVVISVRRAGTVWYFESTEEEERGASGKTSWRRWDSKDE